MNVSRKHWWIKVSQNGRPLGPTLIYREFAPRAGAGTGRWMNLDDCLSLCCPITTTSTTTTSTTTASPTTTTTTTGA